MVSRRRNRRRAKEALGLLLCLATTTNVGCPAGAIAQVISSVLGMVGSIVSSAISSGGKKAVAKTQQETMVIQDRGATERARLQKAASDRQGEIAQAIATARNQSEERQQAAAIAADERARQDLLKAERARRDAGKAGTGATGKAPLGQEPVETRTGTTGKATASSGSSEALRSKDTQG